MKENEVTNLVVTEMFLSTILLASHMVVLKRFRTLYPSNKSSYLAQFTINPVIFSSLLTIYMTDTRKKKSLLTKLALHCIYAPLHVLGEYSLLLQMMRNGLKINGVTLLPSNTWGHSEDDWSFMPKPFFGGKDWWLHSVVFFSYCSFNFSLTP